MEKSKDIVLTESYYAWEEFVNTGEVNNHKINNTILDSWRRCRNAGVDPYAGVCNTLLESWQINELLAKNEELIDVARPFMYKLYEFLQGSGFIVMLTDAKGYILEIFGDDDVMENASTINFTAGGCWQEETVGTNSMGIVVKTKEPIQVTGAEHFCIKSHGWTCSAAPIFDNLHNMIGIFNVSGDSSESHSHTLGMVFAAVEAIEHEMKLRCQNQQLSLVNQTLTNIFTNISEAVIFVDKAGIIKEINPVAKKLLGDLTYSNVENLVIKRHIGQSDARKTLLTSKFNDIELSLKGQTDQINCLVSGSPIKDESGVNNGTVMIIKHMEKVETLVKRYSSGLARFHFSDIVGKSEAMKEAIHIASLAADNNGTILLQGESGTGKEVFAQSIHNASSRSKGPFVAVNCGAIPRELIGSELFGYSEGAFTGAKRGGRSGKFEIANGGTLFLDEIGDMPLEQQVTLLRVLQERRVIRIGDDKVIPVDVRVICATNKDLLAEIERFNFRQDLFYRINVFNIRIPPLRDHSDDVPLLFNHFVEQLGKNYLTVSINSEIYDYLMHYSWPGNVRELQNIVERMLAMSGGEQLTVKHIPGEIFRDVKNSQVQNYSIGQERVTVDGVRQGKAKEECELIQKLLIKNGGNVTKVAQDIGISRNTLYKKIRKYNIST
ncbi:MAG: sigma-54-dependent Fis family transcriptional regulator [Syntrophomonas sp.]